MNQVIERAITAIEPPEHLTVTQWADKYRQLPEKSSIEPGRYSSQRTPYMIEIMDCLSVTSSVTDITFKKGTQLGATEAANNFIGYIIDVSPGPTLLYLPTNDLASAHSKGKLTPTIEATDRLKYKVADLKSRSSSNTILTKDFPGGILFISGANSPTALRNKSIRYLILDDYDGFPPTAGKEGDPGDLAERRTDTFSIRKKIYRNSTPTIKGLSRIDEAYNESDQRTYHVPCPFCGHKQELVWGGPKEPRGIKFKRDNAGNIVAIWYECEKCHKGIDESYKSEMLAAGEWVAKYPKREKRGYHLNSLYSPLGWVSWKQIAQEFLQAKGNAERLKVWTNTRMADVWDEEGSQPEWVLLKNRAEYYKLMTVPRPICFLTSGVDVQKDRLVFIVRGWGPGEESWLITHGEIYGDPERNEIWNKLDELINTGFAHECGISMQILQTAIDSGYASQSVYNFTRLRPLNTMATKGMATYGKPIISRPSTVDVNYLGELIKGGAMLWPLGSDTAKTKIYNRLMLTTAGPGFYHFPMGIIDDYYLQLTAEKRVTEYRNGFAHDVWVKLRERNDILDCEVLALAAAYRAGMSYVDWKAIHPDSQKAAPPPAAKSRGVRSKGIA